MTKNAKLSIAVTATAVLAIVTLLIATGGDSSSPSAPEPLAASGEAQVIRDSSHLLQEGSTDVTLVEFLDFECEACGALFPVIERLREDYEGEVTFAMRYFPIASHSNAELAARAVEAASRQGALEEMYVRMFETQEEWGEQQESKRDLFVSYAEDLGLDTEKFERDLDSPEVAERVELDRRDGLALGITGTPTLFLNGEPLEPAPYEQMKAAIDAALEGS